MGVEYIYTHYSCQKTCHCKRASLLLHIYLLFFHSRRCCSSPMMMMTMISFMHICGTYERLTALRESQAEKECTEETEKNVENSCSHNKLTNSHSSLVAKKAPFPAMHRLHVDSRIEIIIYGSKWRFFLVKRTCEYAYNTFYIL